MSRLCSERTCCGDPLDATQLLVTYHEVPGKADAIRAVMPFLMEHKCEWIELKQLGVLQRRKLIDSREKEHSFAVIDEGAHGSISL